MNESSGCSSCQKPLDRRNKTGLCRSCGPAAKTGAQHPNWKGDKAKRRSVYGRAERAIPIQPCEVCGTTKNVHRHHRNRNIFDNRPGNFRFLCGKDHKAEHKKAGDGVLRGSSNPAAKLSEADVRNILMQLKEGVSQRAVAADFGVSAGAIQGIADGKNWSHVKI